MEPRSQRLRGIAAAPGFARGPVVRWDTEPLDVPRYAAQDPAREEQRLAAARGQARSELARLQQNMALQVQTGEAEVFSAHQLFVDDVSLLKKTRAALAGGLNAEAAWMDAVEAFAAQLEELPDPTLSARSADIRDVGRRVLAHLLGRPTGGLLLERPSVIIAADLAPSQTAALDKEKVLAFCTALGGPTSHTAILAKALGLPAVVALGSEILAVEAGALALVDGSRGEVVIDPDAEALSSFASLSERNSLRQSQAAALASGPAVTLDGVAVEVVANIGSLEDAQSAVNLGGKASVSLHGIFVSEPQGSPFRRGTG